MTNDQKLDYPVAAPDGVEPTILRSQIIQTMGTWFMQAVPGMEREEASTHAMACWETDWPNDPEPRTLDDAKEVVSDELSYWEE